MSDTTFIICREAIRPKRGDMPYIGRNVRAVVVL